jgi:DNA-binding response OmpR family regulator
MENKIKVLVMEDEPILLKALTIELGGAGCEVMTADNGEDGMKFIDTFQPDVLLIDLLMPVKDGYQVLTELGEKNLLDTYPAIVLSNLGLEEERKRAMDLGAKSFFIKSDTDLSQVVDLIRSTLEKNKKNK